MTPTKKDLLQEIMPVGEEMDNLFETNLANILGAEGRNKSNLLTDRKQLLKWNDFKRNQVKFKKYNQSIFEIKYFFPNVFKIKWKVNTSH